MTTVPLAEASAHLSRMIDEAMRTHEPLEIIRNGRREAVLLSAEDYDVLIDTLDVLSDEKLVRDLGTAMEEARRGSTLATPEVLEGLRSAGRERSPKAH